VYWLTFDWTNLISCDNATDTIYIHDGITSTISSSFASPASYPNWLAFDWTNLISCDRVSDTIYIHDWITSTILSSISTPATATSWLAYTWTNLISCDLNSNLIYIYNQNTAGSLSQTAGTNSVKVWEYMSATELLIESGWSESSVSYPSNVYVSSEQAWANSTVFTFTHNLWLTQADVQSGKYLVYLTGNYSSLYVRNYWLTYWHNRYWGSSSSTEKADTLQEWSATNPTLAYQIRHQTNELKIYLWDLWSSMTFKLIVQQLY